MRSTAEKTNQPNKQINAHRNNENQFEKLSLRFIWLQLVENKLNESAVRIDFVNCVQSIQARYGELDRCS